MENSIGTLARQPADRPTGHPVAVTRPLARGSGRDRGSPRSLPEELEGSSGAADRFVARFGYHKMTIDELMATLRPALLQRREGCLRDEVLIPAEVRRKGARDGSLVMEDGEGLAHTLIPATDAWLPAGRARSPHLDLRAGECTEQFFTLAHVRPSAPRGQ